jgi:hypothetical protein
MDSMFLTRVLQQAGQIRISSITDSLFKYGFLLIVLATFASVAKATLWVCILLFSFGGLFLITGLAVFCIFAKLNPDYLRSENYQLKKHSIELLGDKNNSANPHVDKVVLITNPYPTVKNEGPTKIG